MKKSLRSIIFKLLKVGLSFYALSLFSFSGIAGGITIIHASSSSRFPDLFPIPTDTPVVSDTPSPTATSIFSSTPTPASTPISTLTPSPTAKSIPTAIPTPRVQLKPKSFVLPMQAIATAIPPTATPAITPTVVMPTATANVSILDKATSTKTTLTQQPVQNKIEDSNKNINTFMLPLSIGGPLLLASGGMLFWLVRRRQINQYKPAFQGALQNTQPSLWASSNELDPDLSTLHYITGASGALPIPTLSQPSYTPTPTSRQPFTQPLYTPGNLSLSNNTAFSDQMFALSSNETARDLPDDKFLPSSIDTLDLPFGLDDARESAAYQPIPPHPASPDSFPPFSIDPLDLPFSLDDARESAAYQPIPPHPASPADFFPLPIDTLDLPFGLDDAHQPAAYNPISPYATFPMPSTDAPISFTPFPPLTSPPIPITSQTTPPPAIKNDPLLGEVMRQAQAGLFVVLGREKG